MRSTVNQKDLTRYAGSARKIHDPGVSGVFGQNIPPDLSSSTLDTFVAFGANHMMCCHTGIVPKGIAAPPAT